MPPRKRAVNGRRLLIFLAFALAYFFSNFFRSANAIIAGDLTRDFALTAGSLGLMTSVFYIVFAAVQIPLGAGLDRWGPRLVTSGLMLAAALGSLAFSLAADLGGLLVGRALIGAGMGGVLMGAYTAFSRWYSPARFATVSGLLVGLGALGSLSTGAPLAWATAAIGWRAVFAAAAGGVTVSALLVALLVRNSPSGGEAPPDPPLAAEGSAGGDGPPPRPALRLILGDPRFWRIALLNFFMVGTMLSMQGLWSGPYLFDALGYARGAVGNIITLAAVGGLAGYFSCGWLFDRVGRRFAVGVGAGALLASEAALIVAALAQARWLAYPAFVALGFGGAYNILMMAHTRRVFPAAVIGRAVTAVNLFGIGGAALLQWSMGLIINLFPRSAGGRYPPEAYACALALTLTGGVGALLWYYLSDAGLQGRGWKGPTGVRAHAGGEAHEQAEAVGGVEEGGAACDARPLVERGRAAGGGLPDQDRPGDHHQGQWLRFLWLSHVRRQGDPGSHGPAGRGRHLLGTGHQHP